MTYKQLLEIHDRGNVEYTNYMKRKFAMDVYWQVQKLARNPHDKYDILRAKRRSAKLLLADLEVINWFYAVGERRIHYIDSLKFTLCNRHQ